VAEQAREATAPPPDPLTAGGEKERAAPRQRTADGSRFGKVSSTAADPSLAVAEGLAEALAQFGVNACDVCYFGHGTTVATNALIQNRGAPTGLITSDGFRDLLEIGRQKRPELYDLQADKPPVLVDRRLRLEVPERLRYDGRVETALDEVAVHATVRMLRDAGVEAIAICFLYSFLDPAHEAAAYSIVAEEFPEAFVCASHEVAPEFREYERLSTSVVNAYLGPIMASYLRGAADRLTALGVSATPHLTQSNGGVIDFEAAARLPVRTVLSGPSTGVVGAQVTARLVGARDIITFDMGGTRRRRRSGASPPATARVRRRASPASTRRMGTSGSIGGGSGARASKDGLDGVHVHMTNTSNLPVEALEVEYPLTVLRYELVDGSAGPGRFRGGMGLRRAYRAEAECQLRLDGSRLFTPPWGLNGGHPGGRGAFRFGDGVEPFVNGSGRLRAGETVEIITPGASGEPVGMAHRPSAIPQWSNVVETARRWIDLEWLHAARACCFSRCARQSFLASG